ncbi:hypothetical protein BGX27_005308 [Mortierella sp. AM989]|nr:hypothetical protein BGX27_005308 [Mortierella sp. AM989]
MTLSLTDEIRSKTRGLHSKLDKLVQLGLFAVLDYMVYRQILLGFYFVFKTFEEEFQNQVQKSPVNLQVLYAHSPELRRTEALEADLAYFYGPDWKEKVKPTEQVQGYMVLEQQLHDSDIGNHNREFSPVYIISINHKDHIRDISKNKPEKLIAFPATLYLGIFFGGQIAKSKIVKATNFFPSPPEKKLGGENDNGIAIFTFRERDPRTGSSSTGKKLDPNSVKNMLKNRLNSIPGMDDQTEEALATREAIVEEAKEIFVRNMDLITSAEGVWTVWVRWIFTLLLYVAVAVGVYQFAVLQFKGNGNSKQPSDL